MFHSRIAGIAAPLLFLLALSAVAPPRVRAQGSRKDDIALGPRGTPLAGASVAICTQPAVTTTAPCSPLATLYSNAALTQALANPITTDGLGNYNFYATPGKYTIQIYGPSVTTKVVPDVILPSDPSSPTFASVTTTSGISAFSLSLSGNLTVGGNTAVTGTFTVGGAPVPSTNQDLQWSANQRFKGPIPYRDISAFGPPGGCPQLYYMSPPAGTISSGSHTLTISGGAYTATNGCGVAVYGAGPNSSLATPGTVAVSAYSYTGSTTYCYEVAAVDNNLGMSAASAHTCITNGVATLGRDSYNFLSWTSVANAVEYVIYRSSSSGGTYTAIGTAQAGYVGTSAYCDLGIATAPVPDFAPTTAPSAVTAQALFTTIASGGGTTTLTLTAAASSTATSRPVYQDDSWMLGAAFSAYAASTDGFNPTFVVPPGLYWFPHLPTSISSQKIELRGTIYLTGLPIIGNDTNWVGYGGSGSIAGGVGSYSEINVSANVGAGIVLSAGDVENISMPNIFGDGIFVVDGAESVRLENISISEATNGAGSPIRIGSNVILLYAHNWTLAGSQASGGPPDIWFNAETTQSADSIVRISQLYMEWHSIKFDAPVAGGVTNPHNGITFDKILTEGNYDHGLLVFEGNGNSAAVNEAEITDTNYDSNYSNFNPDVLEIGPSSTSSVVLGAIQEGAAPYSNSPGALFGTWQNTFAPATVIVPAIGSSPTLRGGAVNRNDFGVGPANAQLMQNLSVMDGFGNGDVQWGQLVAGPDSGQFSTSTTTGTGSLAAGTYYYVATCINPDGGETLPTKELSATLGSTGEITITFGNNIEQGCIGGLKFYRGTTSGGENVWLNPGSGYYTVYTNNHSSVTDAGTFTYTSATPPTVNTCYYSKLMMDYNSFSYLLADNPHGYSGSNTRLGIGTMTDPGSGSGIKLDVAGGTVRGQSGFIAGTADPAFTNSPRATVHAFIPALTSTLTAATLTLDKAITVTRVQAQAITAPAGCSTNAIVRLTDGTTPINVTLSAAANDSTAITQNYAAGSALTITVSTAAAGCSTSPANVNVEVQYRMQ